MLTRRRPSVLTYLTGAVAVIAAVAAIASLGPGRAGRVHHIHPRPLPGSTGRTGSPKPNPASAGGAPSAAPVTVTAALSTAVRARLPRAFLGLSVEYWDLPLFASHPSIMRSVLGLLRVPGDGSVLLRVGGDSADQAYWGRSPKLRLSPWPYRITGQWLRTLGSLVRSSHAKVLLDLNLAAGSPRMAARFARATLRQLPRRSVAGFEIGNEPDIYHHWIDYHLLGRAGQFVAPSGWDRYSPSAYARWFSRYALALVRVARHIPLAGPATAYPLHGLPWERALVARERGWLGLLTIHRYPLTACAHPRAQDFSTIARVLSPRISAGLVPATAPDLRLARREGLPLRMDELNSVTCEGRRGVSNTFASALWAPDALFSLWKAGLSGANIHVRQAAPNGAFSMSRSGVDARPLLYGLALFARAAGHRGALARLKVGRDVGSVRLWAVRSGRRLNLLVMDKGAHPADLMLRAPSRAPALVQRLTAPRVGATSGVTLAGQTLGPDGRWLGTRILQRLSRGPGGRYHLLVGPYSAALISFRI